MQLKQTKIKPFAVSDKFKQSWKKSKLSQCTSVWAEFMFSLLFALDSNYTDYFLKIISQDLSKTPFCSPNAGEIQTMRSTCYHVFRFTTSAVKHPKILRVWHEIEEKQQVLTTKKLEPDNSLCFGFINDFDNRNSILIKKKQITVTEPETYNTAGVH